ncbi:MULTISPECIES: transcriptional regulator [unclassified Saccharibacter]|uniref:transcriptional regulator n=1 Tax=unclassified Saccharibacter TaxID=2648722 RepID=UPI001323A17E|nr:MULTISPECIES: transcriptional regulator [unclassified Saccharibacter]MXV35958.1 transcriptional regulator [Saccharibacter sp. EH611]MXV35972.1 transcriptional regulator [Saccharibacter sp. EH611]MXV58388.1 transcriptional regulator [Saccharibacter sp. EH70]MXV58927.1 transcriptional regulator [Saccharibacter sp. EH70]MXV65896.1 transcriptional regulator [Saccharibacter sp. EH60]
MSEWRLTADQLAEAGRVAFGQRWQSDLADYLGVDSSRIRGVLSGKRRSPPGWTDEVLRLLRERSQQCHAMETTLRDDIEAKQALLG